MINLITLAGEGSRFSDVGVTTPKPLIPVNGTPMLIRSVSCLPSADSYVFVCRDEHIKLDHIDELILRHFPNSEFITLSETTMGQACTAEIGIRESSIREDDSILISCCDYGLAWSEAEYEKVKSDSDVVVWATRNNDAFCRNPSAYSWLETEGNKLVKTHVKQSYFENPYDNRAIVGTFLFNKAKYFLDGVSRIYEQKIKSNGEYYIDNVFNSISDLSVNVFDVDRYDCWGTPEDLKKYEDTLLG